MHTITVARMADIPVGLKPRMRELTIGPVAWGLWSLTFHDGSTWAAIAYDGDPCAENMIGWGAVTWEYDALPMIGVYVGEDARQRGVGSLIVTTLLRSLVSSGDLEPGATLVASTARWSKYFELADSCGMSCQEWL